MMVAPATWWKGCDFTLVAADFVCCCLAVSWQAHKLTLVAERSFWWPSWWWRCLLQLRVLQVLPDPAIPQWLVIASYRSLLASPMITVNGGKRISLYHQKMVLSKRNGESILNILGSLTGCCLATGGGLRHRPGREGDSVAGHLEDSGQALPVWWEGAASFRFWCLFWSESASRPDSSQLHLWPRGPVEEVDQAWHQSSRSY